MANFRSAKEITVIEVIVLEGEGVEGDPLREVVYYRQLNGEPLVGRDGD